MTAVLDEKYSVVEGVDIASFKPMPNHLLVRWPGKKETKGGILIPQNRERLGLMNGEILAVGPKCNPRFYPGKVIQFSMFCEKEFLGAQNPADRDTVFFMTEENVLGIVHKDVNAIELVNGNVLTRPEKKPEEVSGLLTVNRDDKTSFSVWGEVVQVDAETINEYKVGDSILYDRNMAEELRLGDFEAELMHVVRSGLGGKEIMAVREKSQEIEIQGAD